VPTLITDEQFLKAPKVLLHDHNDGGLRPQTMIEMAQESGYTKLPFYEPDALQRWFVEACSEGTLELYLETFEHTISLMQTAEQIIRVNRECAIDLARSGVVYAEVRGAPELFTRAGLTIDQVIEYTVEGYKQGMAEAKSEGNLIRVEGLLCAMRHNALADEIAAKVIKYQGRGIVGFDIAGPEMGFPPTDHINAFNSLRAHGAHYTIHAGEAAPLESIALAVRECRTDRIGHGIRLIDDISFVDGHTRFGDLAQEIFDKQIALEMAPTSNLQTGGAASYADHPIGIMKELGFNVTINTDNRLMSNTSMVAEMTHIATAHNWTLQDLQDITENAINAAFISSDEIHEILEGQIRPGYERVENL
jgi:adenosine deaminase